MTDPNSDTTKAARPKVNSASQKELDRVEAQFEKFDEEVKSLTENRMAPKEQGEGPRLSQKEIDKSKEIYLKPKRTIFAVDKNTGKSPSFNERFRDDYNFAKEYVQFIFENKEISGETTTIWTRPFPGLPAEEWEVPTNKPIWGPRYLAEQIKRCYYHRLKMEDRPTSADGMGQYYGTMSIDTTIQRLDAHPVSQRKSIFMGSNSFG